MFARSLTLSSLATAVLTAAPAAAQLPQVRPFEGTVTEDFSQVQGGVHKLVRTDVGRISTPNLHGIQVASGFSNDVCSNVAPEVGGQVLNNINHYCTMPDMVRLNFGGPVSRFGGSFLGASSSESTFGFVFHDADNQPVGSAQVTLPADCEWHWVGFELPASTPATGLRIFNPERRWVVADYITLDRVDEPQLGTSYCAPGGSNSTGAPAHLSAEGSVVVSENELRLVASPVPETVGLFFYGDSQVSVPFGNGTRCVAGQSGVFRLPFIHAEANALSFSPDLDAPPSPAGEISPGSTWNFQALFRDPSVGVGFDLSDGLQLTFL